MDVKSAKKPFVAISSRLIQYNDWTNSQDFPLGEGGGGQVIVFREKRSLLVDRLGFTSECYSKVEQKGAGGGGGHPLATHQLNYSLTDGVLFLVIC